MGPRKKIPKTQQVRVKSIESSNNSNYFASKKTLKHQSRSGETTLISEEESRELMDEFTASNADYLAETSRHKAIVKTKFNEWNLMLRNGFSLLVHGLGSKKTVLNEFVDTFVPDMPIVVVLGYLPTLQMRNIGVTILSQIYKKKKISSSFEKQIEAIAEENKHFVLLIHNIDGIALRTPGIQLQLSRLVALPNVHCVASIDHIRVEIQWSDALLYNFNWVSVEAHTMELYTEETKYTKIMSSGVSSKGQSRAIKHVMSSQTTKQRDILKLLARELVSDESRYRQGISFEEFLGLCSEKMLAFNGAKLKGMMQDFMDHNLITFTRNSDGEEICQIPYAKAVIQREILDIQI